MRNAGTRSRYIGQFRRISNHWDLRWAVGIAAAGWLTAFLASTVMLIYP